MKKSTAKITLTEGTLEHYLSLVLIALEEVIHENEPGLNKKKGKSAFEITAKYGYKSFVLNHINGSYYKSVYSLVHFILYEEKIYDLFLNNNQLKEMKKVVKTDPKSIYKPDMEDDQDSEINDLIGDLSIGAIRYIGLRLKEMGLKPGIDFEEYFDDETPPLSYYQGLIEAGAKLKKKPAKSKATSKKEEVKKETTEKEATSKVEKVTPSNFSDVFLYNLVFVFDGIKSPDIVDVLRGRECVVNKKIDTDTNYLVTGNLDKDSPLKSKANELGIPIITIEDIIKKLR